MGGSIQEAADVLGDSEAIVRKDYVKDRGLPGS